MADEVNQATAGGALERWTTTRRERLNRRFAALRLRGGKLSPQDCLAHCRRLLVPLAEPDAPGCDDLLDAVFELILLHAGRGLLGERSSPWEMLLAETFPLLRPLLLKAPRLVPQLSNAVDNLGPRAVAFQAGLAELAATACDETTLTAWGAVLAWRLGEARLRQAALAVLPQIPDDVLLTLLQLRDWPLAAAPVARAAVEHQGWIPPVETIRPRSLTDLMGAGPEKAHALAAAVAEPMAYVSNSLRPVRWVGDFVGYGGEFEDVPVLVSVPLEERPHRFFARAGGETFQLDADAFGWTARRRPDLRGLDTAAQVGPPPKLVGRKPLSWLDLPGARLCTVENSFRIRVLVPKWSIP